jgi:hypothetical protein
MLFNLVKKDFILAKKYWLLMLAFAIGAPIYVETQTHTMSGGLLGFLVTVLLSEYMIFNSVSMAEDKYKGSALLSATPYTRKTLIKAKYLFILGIFVGCYILYTITAFLLPSYMVTLNLLSLGISFLIVAIYYGFIVPLQYRFGYEKVRYISFFAIFIVPFLFPYIWIWFQSRNIDWQTIFLFPSVIQELLLFLLALLIGLISMLVTIRIYSQKDL